MCGTNSPQIAEFGFWDLNVPTSLATPGLPNNIGLQLVSFVKGGGVYLPRVTRGRLVAMPTSSLAPYNTVLAGSSLIGGGLLLKQGARSFVLKVTETHEVASWAQPPSGSTHVFLESYRLDWTEIVNGQLGRFENVCNNPGGRDNLGMNEFHTLVFEGDRIDAERKLDTAIDSRWFNLGCAGSALAKMALTGHTQAAQNARTFSTTLDERQTMLKMLTGDYCGDGTPFTVAGQPLNWADDRSTMKLAALVATPPRPLVREARWKPAGAACLDQPRVDAHWTQLGSDTFGADVLAKVLAHCPERRLQPCDGSTFDPEGYHLVTATEPFQP